MKLLKNIWLKSKLYYTGRVDIKKEEIELKLNLVSEENYQRLLSHFEKHIEMSQTNIFYDTADRLLLKNKWALRLRSENNKGFITAKGVSSKSGAASIRDEIEIEIGSEKVNNIIESPNKIFDYVSSDFDFIKDFIQDAPLVKLVEFNNIRQRIEYAGASGESYLLEIDRTKFQNGRIDYELEVELEDAGKISDAEKAIKRLLESLSIEYQVESKSKFARALEIAGLL